MAGKPGTLGYRTVMFGKPYVWARGADGRLFLSPDWHAWALSPRRYWKAPAW